MLCMRVPEEPMEVQEETVTRHILLLIQIQVQKRILLDPNIWSNYFG